MISRSMTGRARIFALAGLAAAGCYYTVEELQPAGDGGTTNVCTPSCQSDELCVDGTCIKNCGALTDCEGACVNTVEDHDHCGDCDNACTSSQVCQLGECKDGCSRGFTECDQRCFDVLTSPAHCGTCDHACQVIEDCVLGECKPSCESLLTTPFVDPWGNTWDGVNRAASPYATAKGKCETIRARLPLPTEGLRVKNGTLAPLPAATNTELWTAAWADELGQYAIDFADGALTEVPISESREYRCMCPAPDTPGFTSGDCNGSLSNECFGVPFKNMTIDSQDRAILEKPAAIYECNLLGGRLPTMSELAGAATLLLPNGSDLPLFIANDMSMSDSATVAFLDPDWAPGSGGFTRWDYNDDTPFRCTGWKVQPAPNPDAPLGALVSERSGRALDASDRIPAVTFEQALDTCWAAGGHVPMSTELIELVIEGADNGTTAPVQTADHTNALSTLHVAWSGKAERFVYSGKVVSKLKTEPSAYRCIYYPLSSTIQTPTKIGRVHV